MSLAIAITAWIGAVVSWVSGFLLFMRLRGLPGAGSDQAGELPAFSVIIPARDEAENLSKLLPPLAGAAATEVIVVDDQSSDATAEER